MAICQILSFIFANVTSQKNKNFIFKWDALAHIIITTSNNLVFDNRVHKVTTSLLKFGHTVWRTGRNWPRLHVRSERPGRSILFRLPFRKGVLFYFSLNVYTFFFLLMHHFDALWAVDTDTLPGARLAAFLKRKPVIFDSHEFFSEVPELQKSRWKKSFWKFLEKKLIPGCDSRLTVSPGLVELYKKRYDCDFDLLRNLPFNNISSPRPISHTYHPIILYQGSLNIGRGLSETIQAMQYLPGYIFRIVGDGDCTEELKSLTSRLGLNDRIEFVGPVPFEELHLHHKNVMAGMCLLQNIGLNYFYSLPNRIFDYMQAGIPVIASDFPDIARIVNEHQTG
ncbi:MAG: glycosyltransferase, partial [Bacteroidota bacterium]